MLKTTTFRGYSSTDYEENSGQPGRVRISKVYRHLVRLQTQTLEDEKGIPATHLDCTRVHLSRNTSVTVRENGGWRRQRLRNKFVSESFLTCYSLRSGSMTKTVSRSHSSHTISWVAGKNWRKRVPKNEIMLSFSYMFGRYEVQMVLHKEFIV